MMMMMGRVQGADSMYQYTCSSHYKLAYMPKSNNTGLCELVLHLINS